MPYAAPTFRPEGPKLLERPIDQGERESRIRKLYNSAAWKRERLDFLDRNPFCVMCAAGGVVTLATVVDHKEPHRGDERLFWDQDNWQGLCKPHHDSTKQSIEKGGAGDTGFDR